MNTPNPLVPQGTFADKSRSHVRFTVFAILAVHLVLLSVLLIAGCDKQGGDQTSVDPNAVVPPPPPPPVATDWPPLSAPTQTVAAVTSVPPANLVPPVQNTVVDPPPPPPPAAPEFREHTIEAGDSFYTLGRKYGVGYKAIGDANPGVDSTRLRIGQRIRIPPPKSATPTGSASAPAENGATVSATGETLHTVKSGDNLWTLARKYGVKESAIRSANNLRTSQLKVGQKLKIPAKATPPEPVPVPVPPADPGTPPPGAGGLPQ